MKKIILCVLAAAVLLTSVAVISHLGGADQSQGQSPGAPQTPTAREPGNLPLILIDTNGSRIYKETTTWGEVSVVDQANGQNTPAAQPQLTTLATVKYRGNSSYYIFDKRQYRIKLFQSETKSRKYGLLGMGEHSEWVLYGPFLDRSLVRNKLVYDLSRELMDWAPDTRYCEVYVNGEYQGIYLAVEPVTNGAARLDLYEFGLLSGETAYLLRRERVGSEENAISSYGTVMGKTDNELSISYPTKSKLSNAQVKWIERDISAFEETLYGDGFADPEKGYAAYIDVDSFVEYYLINELAMIPDASHLSTYLYKNIGGKLKMAVWDFNNGFDNYPWTDYTTDRFFVEDGNWFDRLLQDRAFVDQVVARYRELRREQWSDERILGLIDGYVEQLGDAVDRNFAVWGYTFEENLLSKDQAGNSRDPKSFEEAIAMLKDCILARTAFLDENIEQLYTHCIN